MHQPTTTVHVYAVSIIDAWEDEGWTQLRRPPLPMPKWSEFWGKVGWLARDVGWEGDIRGDYIYFRMLPMGSDDYPEGAAPFVIGWKQDNNGSTFIASFHELPWLAKAGCRYVRG